MASGRVTPTPSTTDHQGPAELDTRGEEASQDPWEAAQQQTNPGLPRKNGDTGEGKPEPDPSGDEGGQRDLDLDGSPPSGLDSTGQDIGIYCHIIPWGQGWNCWDSAVQTHVFERSDCLTEEDCNQKLSDEIEQYGEHTTKQKRNITVRVVRSPKVAKTKGDIKEWIQ